MRKRGQPCSVKGVKGNYSKMGTQALEYALLPKATVATPLLSSPLTSSMLHGAAVRSQNLIAGSSF